MDRAQSISESEAAIMQILWAHEGPMPLSPLMEALEGQGRRWKANTVLTFLSRLADKGMVKVGKVGRLNQYEAHVSQAAYVREQTRTFIDDVYGGDAKGLIASLLRQERMTPEDVEELRTFWEEAGGDA